MKTITFPIFSLA